MEKNYYAVLGIAPSATPEQLRDRFRELARTRHPDRFPAAEKAKAEVEFQEITQAFNILSDPARRREIDAALLRPRSVPPDSAQTAKVYLQRGVKAFREKNYLHAAESFDRATKEDPKNARAWHFLARAARQQKRWLDQARRAAVKSCELEPMNPDYLKVAGEIFADSDMPAEAEKYWRQALTWGGDDPDVQAKLEALRRTGGKGRHSLFGKPS
jgi:curved DNA-binding protein CbpA